jgi:methionyl aminopeptidase
MPGKVEKKDVVVKKEAELEEDVEEEEEVELEEEENENTSSKNKKKKKKKKKSKSKSAGAKGNKLPPFRGVGGYTDSYTACGQTEPPTIPVAKLFEKGKFPVGEIQEHPGDFNTYRITSAEKRALERAEEDLYDKVRYASEVHRHVRKFAQSIIKPGIRLIDMCEQLEEKNRELVEEAGFAVSSFDFFESNWVFILSFYSVVLVSQLVVR